ncbi:hypothetical protein F2Q70_00008696 [Brassica cretica]|uniref:Uncharacterized protein n=1 Tax=Brassica cretica TaxID=69181 RepID=A0A8S9LWX9_BRACR|nr:hypothetical protein F2Q70_00008696 [Brassica cretica]
MKEVEVERQEKKKLRQFGGEKKRRGLRLKTVLVLTRRRHGGARREGLVRQNSIRAPLTSSSLPRQAPIRHSPFCSQDFRSSQRFQVVAATLSYHRDLLSPRSFALIELLP